MSTVRAIVEQLPDFADGPAAGFEDTPAFTGGSKLHAFHEGGCCHPSSTRSAAELLPQIRAQPQRDQGSLRCTSGQVPMEGVLVLDLTRAVRGGGASISPHPSSPRRSP
jgi:hypothetical protein